MRCFKKLSVVGLAVLALSALGASSASAAKFTYNPSSGTLAGHAKTTQVFTVNGGKIECNGAEVTGTIVELSPEKQDYTVTYRECKAFGTSTVDVSQVTYLFTAIGQVHLQSTLKVTPTVFGASACTLEIKPQTMKSADYAGGSPMVVTSTITALEYTSTGGICGSSGTNGTYSGSLEIERVGGGTISVDP
jgi:hypothetical protein